MVFSSFSFLFTFLPLTLLLYASAPQGLRNGVLLALSYLFYGWGAPEVLPLLVVSSLFDFLIARYIPGRRWLLAFGIAVNLAFLLYYKYSNFFLAELSTASSFFGMERFNWSHIALPIGISFFTFQKISYLVDVFRGQAKAAKSFIDYALYVALFPQLIAGPIIRYVDLDRQMRERRHSPALTLYGINRFCVGLAKKLLIADAMGQVSENVFSADPETLNASYAWLGTIAYSFQIYFDFSGYSDMAIGLGALFGFRIPENFNFPYISRSVTEFWRRWHISLSTWMREYLYIPLGGSRRSTLRVYCNLWIVFLLSGLWHGAQWSYIVWGAFHGLFLTLDKLGLLGVLEKLPRVLAALFTYFVLLFSWVLFRTESVEQSLAYYGAMFSGNRNSGIEMAFGEVIHSRGIFILLIAVLICFLPALSSRLRNRWSFMPAEKVSERPAGTQLALFPLAMLLLFLSTMTLSTVKFSPFIYFRF